MESRRSFHVRLEWRCNLPFGALTKSSGVTDSGTQTTIVTLRNYSASASLNFPNVASGSFQDLTVSVPGAEVGDRAQVTATAGPSGALIYQAWVSSAGVVTVRATNPSGSGIDPLREPSP